MEDLFVTSITEFDLPVHLVMDGAIVDNIEDFLNSYSLVGRPLFRETADRNTVLAGPWLVSPNRDELVLERAILAARSIGEAVLWLGGAGEEGVYRHLRRLNAAQMPDGSILYFRHYDSDVLAAVVPLLDEKQASYLFGSMQVIAFIGGSGDCATVVRPDHLPEAPQGPLAFMSWQIEELDERQQALSRRKIAQLLRQGYRQQLGHLSEVELDKRVNAYEREAQSMNLTSEAAIANWARLDLETDGLASKTDALKSDIARVPPLRANEVFLQSVQGLIDSYKKASIAQ